MTLNAVSRPDHAVAASPRPASDAEHPLLSVRDLEVTFYTENGPVHAVQDVSLQVDRGQTLGIVGESGSGKSITSMSVMGLLPIGGEIAGGEIRWCGEVLDQRRAQRLRGSSITMIFQDPVASLNPLVPVGRQVTESLRKHRGMGRQQARQRAIELFDLVGIPEPRRRLKQYPYEFSGGMAQRVMITMALAPEPDLIIADEPTTALDVTTQAQILSLISDLQDETGVAMMLITHDLGVVAGVADDVVVMYGGRVVEEGAADELFRHPRHPYTYGLLASTPHPFEVREQLVPIAGSPPTVPKVVPGCAFAERCPRAAPRCDEERPLLDRPASATPADQTHAAACWYPHDG